MNLRPTGRRAAAVAALAALVVVGAACSGDPDTSATGTSSTAPAARDADAVGGSVPGTAPAPPGSDPSPSVAPHGDLPTVELDEGEQAYVDALVGQPHPGLDDEQAACIAGHWVQVVGADAIAAAGVTPELLVSGDASVSDVPIDEATAGEIVTAYETCELDLVEVVLAGVSSSAGDDPAKVECLRQAITPEVARRYLVLALTAGAQGPGSTAMDEVRQILEPCLAAG